MAAKIRIAFTGYQIQKDPNQEKLDLITGIFNLVQSIQKGLDKPANITLIHGAGSALDLWAGEAAINLGLHLEIYLPFPRITHIVRSKLNPIQAENLNLQIDYADRVKVISKTYHYHGILKRTKALVDASNMAAVWDGENKKTKNFWDYCRNKKKPTKDLIFYSLFPVDNIHLQGEL